MIAIASDHGGFDRKESVKKHLEERGIEYKDFGTYAHQVLAVLPDHELHQLTSFFARNARIFSACSFMICSCTPE